LAGASRGGLKVSPKVEFGWARARIICVFVAVACVTGAGLGARANDAATYIDIGNNEIGAPPAEFDMPRQGEDKQGKWTIVHDGTATAGVAIEQSGVENTEEDRFPLAISKTVPLRNVEISLRLKATGGTTDRDGGIALRLRTPNNYYLVQLDALRDRVLFSLVTDGVPNEIVGVDADIASHTWHTLAVRAKDDQFIVSLDGTWVFTGFDRTLSQPGRVALWTKGDSITRFDSIVITPLPAAAERY
jgi:hypothetical protein